jgi:hypothetical protein
MLAVAVGMLAGGSRGSGAELTKAQIDNACEARRIFRAHCVKCHGGPTPKAGLNLLDVRYLEVNKLIGGADAEDTPLFDHVASGRMPPGTRPKLADVDRDRLKAWVVQEDHDPLRDDPEAYALWWIARDVQSRPQDWPHIRYVSFEHLRGKDEAAFQSYYEQAIEDLKATLKVLRDPALKDNAIVAEVDPSVALVRLDLRKLGWNADPYHDKDAPLNLFDLLLLEYPHGEFPAAFLDWYGPLRDYLAKSNQVRSIPYLRGEWLLKQFQDEALKQEFATVLELTDATLPRLRSKAPAIQPAAPRPDLKRLRIPPVDAITPPTLQPAGLEVTFRVTAAQDKDKPDPPTMEKILEGDKIDYRFKVSRAMTGEIWQIDEDRKINPLVPDQKQAQLSPDQEASAGRLFKGSFAWAFQKEGPAHKPQIVLFASAEPFPAGHLLQARGRQDRFLHRVYRLKPDSKEWDGRSPDSPPIGRWHWELDVRPKKESP